MLKSLLSRAVVVVAALMLALCAGAVWSVLALMLGEPAQWMALPCGAVAVWAVDWVAPRHAWVRALLAIFLVLIAAAYAYYLYSASVVSMNLGIPFGDALRRIGAEMAFAVSLARAPLAQGWLIALSALVAAAVSWRRGPRTSVPAVI